jgi:hypothetical protein
MEKIRGVKKINEGNPGGKTFNGGGNESAPGGGGRGICEYCGQPILRGREEFHRSKACLFNVIPEKYKVGEWKGEKNEVSPQLAIEIGKLFGEDDKKLGEILDILKNYHVFSKGEKNVEVGEQEVNEARQLLASQIENLNLDNEKLEKILNTLENYYVYPKGKEGVVGPKNLNEGNVGGKSVGNENIKK